MKKHAILFSVYDTISPILGNVIVNRNPGAHRIATFLREKNWDVEVIDFVTRWTLEEIQELVRSRVNAQTVFFGFSSMFSHWTDNLNDFTAWLKQTYSHIPTVRGGNSVLAVDAKNIDYWIDGYGEMAILALAQYLGNSGSPPLKFDVAWFGSRKVIKALHAYPAYPMPSYSIRFEHRDFVKDYEWATFEFSRGCKFKCSFCNYPILGVKEDHTASVQSADHDLRYNYDNFGIKNYYVVDETFNDSVSKIKKYADVVESLPFRPFFSGYQRVDLLINHPESWQHLVRMNFGGQYYGVESFNHQSVKAIGKGMHPDRVKQGLLDIKKYFLNSDIDFYRGNLSFIIGLPHETEASVKDARDWLLENWMDQSASAQVLHLIDPESSQYHTNISEFTRNLYNNNRFRRMPDTTDLPSFAHQQVLPFHEGQHGIIWEHDSMNLPQAMKILDNWRNHITSKVKIDNWKLHVPFFSAQNRDLPWQNVEAFKKIDVVNIDSNTVNEFLAEYKHKKLSL